MTATIGLLAASVAWAIGGLGRRVTDRRLVRRRFGLGRRTRVHPLAALGSVVVGLLPGAGGVGPELTRRIGACVVGTVVGLAVSPALGVAAVVGLVVPPLVDARRRPGRQRAAAVSALPDVVDLLSVAARAGLPAAAAVAAVAERAPPPWRSALQAVVDRCGRGERFVDAVDELLAVAGGDVGAPLRGVLRAAAEDGADLVGGLDRLAADTRDLRRRRAEESARRVPVRLLLPLVACSLPAFALLTIVPIVVGALRDLDL